MFAYFSSRRKKKKSTTSKSKTTRARTDTCDVSFHRMYVVIFFFCSLHAQYMSMCANLSTDWRLSVLVLVLATNIAHSLTCFFSVRFAFCRIFCCCYLYLLCCTFLLSARCLFFSVLFALTASLPSLLTYFPLLIGLLFLPLTQSFSFYDFQLFFLLPLCSRRTGCSIEKYLPSANASC